MSNPDSNKKQPSRKPNNSYSLLLKGLSDAQKSNKPKSSSTSKKPTIPPSNDDNMNSRNKVSQENSSSSNMRRSGDDDYEENPSNVQEGETEDPDVPDRSYGDYYCKICDSHMNSDNMWEAHITGKRHIKNVKKGDTDSKYEDLPDVESAIKNEMKTVKEPVVGLSYIHEIRRKEPNVPPIYNCFLCHASIATVPLVTEHVISMKHRLNYIKENNPEEYELIEATNLKKGHMEPLVIEAARAMEQKYGRGTVKVKQEKKKSSDYSYSGKKTFNLDKDFEDRYREPFKSSRDDTNTSLWKSVDTGKNFGRRDRSRSPRDYEDNFMIQPRSRSPKDFRERSWMHYGDEERSMDGYKRSYPRKDISPILEDYERPRSFSKRDASPRRISPRRISPRHISPRRVSPRRVSPRHVSPRRVSPRHDDYRYRGMDSYSHSSRNVDSLDRQKYVTPSFDHTNTQKPINKSFNNFDDHQKSASYLPPERSVENPIKPRDLDDIFGDILLIPSEDCYKLFLQRMKMLPEIKSIGEMLLLTKIIAEAQKKLKSKLSPDVVAALTEKFPKADAGTANIPGLNEAMSSAELHSIGATSSFKPCDAERFINNIFKSADLSPINKPASQSVNPYQSPPVSFSLPNSYQTPPVISPQQAALSSAYPASSYQAPLSSYQAPAASSYQAAAASSYQAPAASSYQAPAASSYQAPAASSYQAPPSNSFPNMPFSSGSMSQNTTSGIGSTQNAAPNPQVYNYSRYSSTSSASNNYPRKY